MAPPRIIWRYGWRYRLAQPGRCQLDFNPPVRFHSRKGYRGSYEHADVSGVNSNQAVSAFVQSRLVGYDQADRVTWVRPNSGGALRVYQLPADLGGLLKVLQDNVGPPGSSRYVWCRCDSSAPSPPLTPAAKPHQLAFSFPFQRT